MGPYCVFATVPVTVRVAAWVAALALVVALAWPAAEPVELGPVPLAIACGDPVDGAGVLAGGTDAASE
jgi:hypothetical protein